MNDPKPRMLEDFQIHEDFTPSDVVVLMQKGPNKRIISCTGEFKGTKYFNLREIYLNDESKWKPGSGLSVPMSMKAELIAALKKL